MIRLQANKFSLIGISVALCHVGLLPEALAEVRSPGQGNPLDSLPKVDTQPAQPVTVDIQSPPPNAALQRLLASRIKPSKFQIAGVKSIPFEQVSAEFVPLTNREITVAELLQAANNVTRLYQEKGYPLSFAFVPDQSFKDNVVVISVVEGYVAKVRIEGSPGASEERLRHIAEQLTNDRPLSKSQFERITSILGLQPGMRIKATVTPPTTTDGAAEMVLDVNRKPFNASLGLDTAHSSPRGVLSASLNGISPLGEQLTVSTLVPKGPSKEEYYAVNYAQPIRWQGMLLNVNLSRYSAEPENRALVDRQFEARYQTRTERASINLSYPLVLTASRNLTLSGGVYAARNNARYTRSVPTVPTGVEIESDIRAVSLEINSIEVTPKSSTQYSLGIYQGIDGAGASRFNSNVDLDFLRLRGSFTQSNTFTNGYGVVIRGSGQYSGDILPLSEQISFGARHFGLAYPAGETAGDKGWGLALEFNRAFERDGKYVKQVQPYVLGDTARTYLNGFDIAGGDLASLGFGVRLSDKKHYSLDLSVAQPVGDIPINANKRSPRFNLSYAYQFE
ncbi:POTRA domain-containing protein [uncultured Oxalicibacterium sp.]|uniref:ShlB/FhaC/HecB family hemolysin secretion/activation protein n=1 Tax=uncultured Oxalicibacterium sp. TaxID=1168540 RepID=UPI0026009A54|nr:POTRA domain-containing protein [uncultured Oxalicibacterium sp.]